MLSCHSKVSITVSCCPTKIDSSLQILVHHLVNGAIKFCPVVDISMGLFHVAAKCEFALGYLGLCSLKSHLVAK